MGVQLAGLEPGTTDAFVIRFYDDNGGAPGAEIFQQEITSWAESVLRRHVHPTEPWVGYEFTADLSLRSLFRRTASTG